jgi:hypothetical protein
MDDVSQPDYVSPPGNTVGYLLCRGISYELGYLKSVQCLTDWTTGVRSQVETKDFSCSFCVQTSSEAHPASRPMGTGDPFRRAKARPGRNADHSPPSSAEVKNEETLAACMALWYSFLKPFRKVFN